MKYTYSEIEFVLLKKFMLALLVVAGGLHALDIYMETLMVVLGYMLIGIGIMYIIVIGIAAIRLSRLYKSRG